MPRAYAARLLYDHATDDWRDLFPLSISRRWSWKASLVGWRSQVWIGSQIPGSRVEIFDENEGGNHFMFMENSEKFNRIVKVSWADRARSWPSRERLMR
jgi:non-heme chloroperoxidase